MNRVSFMDLTTFTIRLVAYIHVFIFVDSETKYCNLEDSIKLVCERPKNKDLSMMMWWSPDEKPISMGESKLSNDNSYTVSSKYQKYINLMIGSVQRRHKGTFSCKLESEVIQEYHLVISGPPEIPAGISVYNEVTAEEGSTVNLFCNITGYPKPRREWFAQDYDIQIEGGLLQIRNVSRDCPSTYVCRAENIHSEEPINITYNVDVQFPMEVSIYDMENEEDGDQPVLYRKKGTWVKLRCDVWSNPDVTVRWMISESDVILAKVSTGKHDIIQSATEQQYLNTFQYNVDKTKKNIACFDISFKMGQYFTYSKFTCLAENPRFGSKNKTVSFKETTDQ